MNPQANQIFRTLLGVFFIIIGVISFAVPFLSGWVFIIIGLALLGSRKAQRSLSFIRSKVKRWFGSRTASLIVPDLGGSGRKSCKKNI